MPGPTTCWRSRTTSPPCTPRSKATSTPPPPRKSGLRRDPRQGPRPAGDQEPYSVSKAVDWLDRRARLSLANTASQEPRRHRQGRDRKTETRRQDLPPSAGPTSPRARSRPDDLAEAVRSHWGIENDLHWVLDVTFNEDQSRLRNGHGAKNMAVVRHFALNLVRQAKESDPSSDGEKCFAAPEAPSGGLKPRRGTDVNARRTEPRLSTEAR